MYKAISIIALTMSVNCAWADRHVHRHAPSPLINALRVGTDTNGAALYLCRAKLFNSMQPGKTWAGYGRCNVAYAGKEYILSNFSIPNQREFGRVNWSHDIRGAVTVGKDTNGAPLFLCQTTFNRTIQPGKTWPGYNHCNITYAGREVVTDNFQILTNDRTIVVRSHPQQQSNMHSHH